MDQKHTLKVEKYHHTTESELLCSETLCVTMYFHITILIQAFSLCQKKCFKFMTASLSSHSVLIRVICGECDVCNAGTWRHKAGREEETNRGLCERWQEPQQLEHVVGPGDLLAGDQKLSYIL